MRRFCVLIALVAATFVPSPARAAVTHDVYMFASAYCVNLADCVPGSVDIQVAPGDTVRWNFVDPLCYPVDLALGQELCYHDVISETFESSPHMSFQDGVLEHSVTFQEEGTYAYLCSLHAEVREMRANVVVG